MRFIAWAIYVSLSVTAQAATFRTYTGNSALQKYSEIENRAQTIRFTRQESQPIVAVFNENNRIQILCRIVPNRIPSADHLCIELTE